MAGASDIYEGVILEDFEKQFEVLIEKEMMRRVLKILTHLKVETLVTDICVLNPFHISSSQNKRKYSL